MAAPMERLTAYVQIDYGSSEEEVRAVEDLFRELDVEVDVTPGIAQFSEIPPWVFALIIELNPFLVKLQQLAAEDAYLGLKKFVQRAREARRLSGAPDGTIEIEDRSSGVSLKGLVADMPDDAYLALRDLDLESLPRGSRVGWSDTREEWIYQSPGDVRDETPAVPLRGSRGGRES